MATRVAIIGGGFSGVMLALQLLDRQANLAVTLIGREAPFGLGVAYATANENHLLNVRAARISLVPDDPQHFIEWLRRERPPCRHCGRWTDNCFAPRRYFGAYVQAELAARVATGPLSLVTGNVTAMTAGPPHRLTLEDGRTIEADIAVLALGNFPPVPPPVKTPGFYKSSLYHGNPWSPAALAGLDPAAPVLLIGTGLTMIDMVVSLLDQGHTGPITALSRRGLLPRRQADIPPIPPPRDGKFPATITGLLRMLRARASEDEWRGLPWQTAMEQIRHETQDIWAGLPLAEQRRFLRHGSGWWDIHRHRIPNPVADRINNAQARRALRIFTGYIQSYHEAGGLAEVTYRPRGSRRLERFTAARVINCTGPARSCRQVAEPLLQAVLTTGLGRPDGLGIGLDVTPEAALRDAGGAVSGSLYAVGALTRGIFWEITAVPDIRAQCVGLAKVIAHRAGAARLNAA